MPEKLPPELTAISDAHTTRPSVPNPSHSSPFHRMPPKQDSPFNASSPGLLLAKGSINGISCTILFDDGAELCYLASQFTKKNDIPIKESPYDSHMANGSLSQTSQTQDSLEISFSGFSEQRRFAVCPLYSYDVILGKTWHSKFNPDICYRENLIKFHNGERKFTVNATLKKCNKLISANSLMKDVRRKHPVFAILLRSQEKKIPVNSISSPIPSNIKEIVDEYVDVFPNELPSGLPPERSHDFKIELEPGSIP